MFVKSKIFRSVNAKSYVRERVRPVGILDIQTASVDGIYATSVLFCHVNVPGCINRDSFNGTILLGVPELPCIASAILAATVVAAAFTGSDARCA